MKKKKILYYRVRQRFYFLYFLKLLYIYIYKIRVLTIIIILMIAESTFRGHKQNLSINELVTNRKKKVVIRVFEIIQHMQSYRYCKK